MTDLDPPSMIGGGSKNDLDCQVLQHMRERLSEHKQPLGGVRFLKSIPKSASGKILRRELQKKAL